MQQNQVNQVQPSPAHEASASPTNTTVTPNQPPQSKKPKRKLPLAKLLVAGIVILITVFAFGIIAYLLMGQNKTQEITSYEECVSAGYPIMESYPEKCAANGQTFTRKLTNEEKTKLDPTTDWKTYENTAVGFSVKYPSRYPKPQLPSGAPGNPPVFADGTEDNERIIFGEKSTDSFGIMVFPYTGTTEDLISYKNTPGGDGNSELVFIKNLKLDKNIADWYLATPPTIYPGNETTSGKIKIFYSDNGYGFIFDFNLDYDEEEIEQILSTFKSTDKNSSELSTFTLDENGWKIFTLPNYSISVPSEFNINNDSSTNNYLSITNYDVNTAPGRDFSPSLDAGMLKIEIVKADTNKILDEYMNAEYSNEFKKIKINNALSGYEVVGKEGPGTGYPTYFIEDPITKEFYYINFWLDFNNFSELRNQILSTFKFTE